MDANIIQENDANEDLVVVLERLARAIRENAAMMEARNAELERVLAALEQRRYLYWKLLGIWLAGWVLALLLRLFARRAARGIFNILRR